MTTPPTGFIEWFQAAYPINANGNRPALVVLSVMDLMQAAWAAGQAEIAEAVGAGGVSALIPQAERERCALICEMFSEVQFSAPNWNVAAATVAQDCADTIRS